MKTAEKINALISEIDKLRDALKQIEQMSDSGDQLTTVINMKSIATEALKK